MKSYHIQGYNGDLDTGAEEDLVPQGGTQVFPAAAAATTVVSSSANDDAAGTGARTVRIHGLDSDLNRITEDVTMDGTTPVACTNEFYRVNAVEVLTAGSGATNAGAIDVKHNTDVLSRIEAGIGRSRNAIFTASARPMNHAVVAMSIGIEDASTGTITGTLMTRKSGGVWQARASMSLYGTGLASNRMKFEYPIHLEPGEDVKLKAATTADNANVFGLMEIIGQTAPIS